MSEITRPKPVYVKPADITEAKDFRFRQFGISKAHVRTLMQALRNSGGKLDPILLWKEAEADGTPTGRLILLDGAHRLAAYHSTRKKPSAGNRGVRAAIMTCDRAEAMLAAIAANAKESLALSPSERADAAWRLVRLPEVTLFKARIAEASGVSVRTVAYMRKRLKKITEANGEISGEWWRDRQDASPEGKPTLELTDKERTALIIKLGNDIRAAAGGWEKRDADLLAEGLRVAFGYELKCMTEYLYGDADEFFNDHPETVTGAADEDPEPDF